MKSPFCIMAYGSMAYLGMTRKKMAATLKVQKINDTLEMSVLD